MGLLRVLLALSVVFTHAGGLDLVGGRNAVQIFYMISGFLISYVITERRSYPSVTEFYASRYARLWPQYAVIAALTFATFYFLRSPTADQFFEAYRSLDTAPSLLLTLSNAFLFGQDWLMFAEITDGAFGFSSNFREAAMPAYYGLITPQAWTLGVELTFYAIAPFVLPRRWLMMLLLGATIAIRLALVKAGLGLTDPWTYRFFPAELLFFLVGAFVQQLGSNRYQAAASRYWDIAITAALTLLVVAFPVLPAPELLKSAALMGCCALALPALFRFQHGRGWDVAIGDLSYPIYINHVLVITLLTSAGMRFGDVGFALLAAAISIALAWVMNILIGEPVEKWRRRLKQKASPLQGELKTT